MRSMTGFAEMSFDGPGVKAKISIKSLNHRFFDWSYKGAPLGKAEGRLRAIAQRELHRGRIEVTVDLALLDPSSWEISVSEGLLGKLLEVLEKASRRIGKSVNISVDNLLRIPQVVEIRRKDLSREEVAFLERSFETTLDGVVKERIREGKKTANQIRSHLKKMKMSWKKVESLARKQPRLLHEKLRQRLKELENEPRLDGGKLEEEVAFLAQRADITEEILRLRTHLDSFDHWLGDQSGEPAGKMMDFLSLEILREANTINSKSQDINIIKASLAIKNEVENIRQQVQNIE